MFYIFYARYNCGRPIIEVVLILLDMLNLFLATQFVPGNYMYTVRVYSGEAYSSGLATAHAGVGAHACWCW